MRIAIMGAGLGGLACARMLQRGGMDVEVFERESDRFVRGQGGTLDLHGDTGQPALARAGLLERFTELARPEGQEMRAYDSRTAELVAHEPAEGDFHPEIDRGQLRDLLLDSLTGEPVRWGSAVREVRTDGTVLFADGRKDRFDVVVGADGAWSRVRAAVSDAVPDYTGVTFFELCFDDADRTFPELADLVGGGTMMATRDGLGIAVQRNSGSHLRAYVMRRGSREWDGELLALFDGWAGPLRRIIARHDGPVTRRPINALPVPHEWPSNGVVTLLGDAAHLMPPLGVGANLALLDGVDLAEALLRNENPADGLAEYERVMLPRSIETAAECLQGMDDLLGAPEEAAVAVD